MRCEVVDHICPKRLRGLVGPLTDTRARRAVLSCSRMTLAVWKSPAWYAFGQRDLGSSLLLANARLQPGAAGSSGACHHLAIALRSPDKLIGVERGAGDKPVLRGELDQRTGGGNEGCVGAHVVQTRPARLHVKRHTARGVLGRGRGRNRRRAALRSLRCRRARSDRRSTLGC